MFPSPPVKFLSCAQDAGGRDIAATFPTLPGAWEAREAKGGARLLPPKVPHALP
jgi:hypothetical protein